MDSNRTVLRMLLSQFALIFIIAVESVEAFHPVYKQWDDSNPEGVPGVDYPIYSSVPRGLPFRCNQVSPGFYADPDTQCQVWHLCDLFGRRHSFLCPNRTMFNQLIRGCDWWYNVDCDASSDLYYNNEDVFQSNRLDRFPSRIAHTIKPQLGPVPERWTTPRPFVPFIPPKENSNNNGNNNENSLVSQPPQKPVTFQVVRAPVTTPRPPPPPPPAPITERPQRPAVAFTPPRPAFSRIRPKPTRAPPVPEQQAEFVTTSSPEGPPTAWTVRFIAGSVDSAAPPRGIRPVPLDQQWRIAQDQERAFPDLPLVTQTGDSEIFHSTQRTPHVFQSSPVPEQEFPISSQWTTSRPWTPVSTPSPTQQPEEQQQPASQPPQPLPPRRPAFNRIPTVRPQLTQPPSTPAPSSFSQENFASSARTPFVPFGARTTSTWASPIDDIDNSWQDTTVDDRDNNNDFNSNENNRNNNINLPNSNENDSGRSQWGIGALDIARQQTFAPEPFTESFFEETTEPPFVDVTSTQEPFFWSDTPFSPEVPFGARTTTLENLISVEQEVEIDSQTVATPPNRRRPNSSDSGWWGSSTTESPNAIVETQQPFSGSRSPVRVTSPKSAWWTTVTAQPPFEPFNRSTTFRDAPAVVKHSVSFSPSTPSSTARFTSRIKSSRAPHRVSTHSAAWWTETSSEAAFEVNEVDNSVSFSPEPQFEDTAQTDNADLAGTTEFERLWSQSTQSGNEITTYHPRRRRPTTTEPTTTEAPRTSPTPAATERVPRVRTSRRRKLKETTPATAESTEPPTTTTTTTFSPTLEPEPSIPLVFGARIRPRKFFVDNSVADSVLQPHAVAGLPQQREPVIEARSSQGTAYDLPVVVELRKQGNKKDDTRHAAI